MIDLKLIEEYMKKKRLIYALYLINLGATLSLSGCGRSVYDDRMAEYNTIKDYNNDIDDSEFIDEFNQKLKANPNINSFLEEYNINYDEFLSKYSSILNKSALLDKASSLKIEENDSINTVGQYYFTENTVYINKDLCITEDNPDEISSIISHEFYHFLLSNGTCDKYIDDTCLSEGTTELISCESLNDVAYQTYKYRILYTRILAELSSDEAMLSLGGGSDLKLIRELSEYMKENDVRELIDDIKSDIYNERSNIYGKHLKDRIFDRLDGIYEKKYGSSIYENDYLNSIIQSIYNYNKDIYFNYTKKLFLNKDKPYYYKDVPCNSNSLIQMDSEGNLSEIKFTNNIKEKNCR